MEGQKYMGYGVTICTDDIVGLAEIAEYTHVSTPAVKNWINRYIDFPKPIRKLKCGPLFNMQEVLIWLYRHHKIEQVGI